MKLFGYEIRKANTPTIYKKNGGFFGAYGEEPVSNLDLLYTIYRKNTDARRCVTLIAKNIGQDGYFFEKNGEIVDSQELSDVVEYVGLHTLKIKIIRDILVSGNAYIVKIRNDQNKLIGLDTIDPRTTRLISDDEGHVSQYQQVINSKVVNKRPVEDVINCFDELDPDNEIFGLSVIESIVLDVLADKESALSNYYYFKNNAIPARLLIAGPNASNEEMQNVAEQLRKNFSGGKNKHKIGVLKGIEKIEQIQDSVTDMQYKVLRGFTTERVCVAFDVPRVVLGYTDGVNYSNHDGQFNKFIKNTIGPREKSVENRITEALEFDGIVFKIHNTKTEITKEYVEIMEIKQRNGWITPEEGRKGLGYSDLEENQKDNLLISKNYDKLSDVGLTDIPFDDS